MTLAKRDQTSQTLDVLRNLESPYMPGFDSDDYAPPEYRIVQGLSTAHTQDGVALGVFYCEQTGDVRETLDFIILRVGRNLSNWDKNNRSFPVCSSEDRIIPRPGGKFKGPCGTCPARGKECFPGYNILAMLCDDKHTMKDEPVIFLLRVNGTSVYPFRKLWPEIKLKYANNPWMVQITVTSERRMDKNTYWVMKPEIQMELPEDWQAYVKAIADSFLSLDINAVDREAQQQHMQANGSPMPEVDRSAGKVIDSQAVQGRKPNPITKEQAVETVAIAKNLGVPEKTISAYIANAFQPKTRLMDLHSGEVTMLQAWLYQEYGQTQEQPIDPALDDFQLPF